MNPELFIRTQIISNLSGDYVVMCEAADEAIDRYRKDIFDSVAGLITETREKLRKKLALCDWVTIKEFMSITGLSEYKSRKHMRKQLVRELVEVDRTTRPYQYKAA